MNTKSILSIVVVVIIIMGAVFYLNNKDNSTSPLSSGVTTTQSSDAQDIYSILQKMDKAKLDDSIFSNPAFESLKDNTVTFVQQESGRNNPFAPIGSNSPVQSTSSRSI